MTFFRFPSSLIRVLICIHVSCFFIFCVSVGSGGLIAVDSYGEYSMEFNSKGMFRGVCDSTGECSVGIWEEMIPIVVTLDDITLSPLSDKTDSVSSVEEEQSNGIKV